MQKRLLIPFVITVAAADTAGAGIVAEKESDEILANGEVTWASANSPMFVMRYKGKVFFCQMPIAEMFSGGTPVVKTVCYDDKE